MGTFSQSLHSAWQEALEQTRARSPASFDQWFSGVQYDGFEAGILRLTARDEFVRDWVKAHFLPTVLAHLRELLGEKAPEPIRVDWTTSSELPRPVSSARASSIVRKRASRPPPPEDRRSSDRPSGRFLHGDSLNSKHTF